MYTQTLLKLLFVNNWNSGIAGQKQTLKNKWPTNIHDSRDLERYVLKRVAGIKKIDWINVLR